VLQQINVSTEHGPEQFFQAVFEFAKGKAIDRIGIATFGPVCLDPTD
jgi:hypothetical protein